MKRIASIIVAIGIAASFAMPASAAMMMKMHKTKASCEKAHMMWDATTKKCMKGSM
jgi:hypothetical protein